MLTRAKSFEVVVGNPETLKKDPFWKAFVEYCESNRSLVRESNVDLLNFNFGKMQM
jgi:superfamily I DNA and/or RNA helicase